MKKESKKQLKGIGGWLIVFILWIAYQIYGYSSSIIMFTFKLPSKTLEMFEQIGFGAAFQHPILNAVLSIIPLIFFIYTAILLFKKLNSFIKIAKLTVWISFIADTLAGILMLNKWGFFLIPLQLIPTAILILYLTYSKRVVNTFVRDNKEKAEKLKKIESTNRKRIVIWTIVLSIIILLLLLVVGIVKLVSFGMDISKSFDEISKKIKIQSVNESLAMCNNFTGFTAKIMEDRCLELVALYNSNKTGYRDGRLCNLIPDSNKFNYPEERRDACFYRLALNINDTSLCDKVSNSDLNAFCYAFLNYDDTKCSLLSTEYLIEECYKAINPSIIVFNETLNLNVDSYYYRKFQMLNDSMMNLKISSDKNINIFLVNESQLGKYIENKEIDFLAGATNDDEFKLENYSLQGGIYNVLFESYDEKAKINLFLEEVFVKKIE